MWSEIGLLLPLFFLIAFFYAAAGFGGGSSYLAVLSLFSIEFTTLRILALLCNITVVSGSVLLFYRTGRLRVRRVFPLTVLSVPFAYWGGTLRINEQFFSVLLGCALSAAALLMFVRPVRANKKFPVGINTLIGSGIGFLSGLVGIGGGIFLSPLLYLTGWGKAKEIAGCTAFFILVNSAAGLVGQTVTHGFAADATSAFTLMCAVFIGGQLGVRLTVFRLNPGAVKKITALLILPVALRLLAKSFI